MENNGMSWDAWLQGIGSTLVEAKLARSTQPTQSVSPYGQPYQDGKPASAISSGNTLLIVGAVAAVVLVAVLVKS